MPVAISAFGTKKLKKPNGPIDEFRVEMKIENSIRDLDNL